MGPTGVTDWPRLLCKAFTGKSFDQFDDDVLAYLLITLDEAIGAAVLNTVFGGYPGLSKLYGYRFSERQIQPGNTHPPLLPDHLSPEAQQMEREAKRHCALAPSARANEQVPQPVTAPAPLPQAPTASVSKTPEPRWVRFVVPKDNESDDEDFCLVSTAGTDADKNAQTIEIAAVLSGPDRKLAAKQFASSELPGCPAKVVNGRIIVTVGKHSFALPQQSMRSLNSSGDGYFPDKTDVIIQIRSMSGIVVPSAPSTACWMLAKYAIFVKGAGHRSRYQPVGGIVDDAWARFLHLLAEVMTLRGVSRGTRMQLTGGGIGSV